MNAAAKYPHLLSPITIGPKTLKHRAIVSGHTMRLGDDTGLGERYRAYLLARARGGAALVGIESAPILPSSQNDFSRLELYRDEIVESLAHTADAVHDAGSMLSIILWHSGHNISHQGGEIPLAPSAIPSPTYREVPKVASHKDIRHVVAAYGQAAKRCADAGIDFLEVQTATDYLLGSFLSPTLNKRNDEYGGSLQNRTRIVCEVLEVVREQAGPNVAVGVRTSAAHMIPNDPHDYGLEDAIAAMSLIAERGLLDYVSVITGSQWSMVQTLPTMTLPRMHIAEQTNAFRAALDIPITIAGRIRQPAEAEAVIAQGKADVVAMARTWIAEPEWMNKIQAGHEDQIRPCMSCNQGCLGFMVRNMPGSCVVNAAAGREFMTPEARPAEPARRIVIVGGGPAGMEAARIAATRGHQVSLYEAREQLGSDMRIAAEAPHRGEMLPTLAWWESELDRLGVETHLGARVDEPPAGADVVIWAIGSEPAQTAVWRSRPYLNEGIPGSADLPHGREVMRGKRSVSGHVRIIDEEGGWPTVSLVETLSTQADISEITVTTTDRLLGEPDLLYTLEISEVAQRLQTLDIEVHTETLVDSVDGDHITTMSGTKLGPFDSIVLATGAAARSTPSEDLAIGDCVTPRGFWGANNDAIRLALEL